MNPIRFELKGNKFPLTVNQKALGSKLRKNPVAAAFDALPGRSPLRWILWLPRKESLMSSLSDDLLPLTGRRETAQAVQRCGSVRL
jgi:hypothetical protein